MTDGVVHLLQSRPITSLAGRADPDAPTRLFDNSNIAESYSGVTSAMTFSFARFAYEHVYREFCRLMRVPAATIETQNHVFTHLLARVRGRVYYNLINWYRVLTLLPGFRANRAFMEQMMGVSEDLPEEIAESLAHTTWSQRMSDRLGLLGSSAALLVHHLRLPRTIKRFQRRLDATLVEPDPPLSARRLDELADDYRRLETALLKRWDAPLINDFLAMIFFGVLGKLTRTWCGDEHGTLQNDLLVGEGGIVSSEPARRVVHMARLAAGNDELIHALQHEPWRRAMRHLGDHSQLAGEIDDYLARFGDRCLEELKLESPTLSDDPTALLRSIGAVAATQRSSTEDSGRDVGTSTRAAAETRVAHALHRRPLRSIVFAWVLRNARHRVRDRENLRFERTRVFGRVRRLILHMGRHLHVHGKLDDPRDVFHLELHELLGFITGDAACDDLAGVVAVRRAEDERYRGESPPPRFTTQGPPGLLTDLLASRSEATTEAAFDANSELRGIGCCPGVVRGRARVIRDPRGVALQPGDILVAERTDPGWVLLFPAAAGVVVERGSLLSHSAIVARELGLPAVVSVPGLMATLRDGETIELDGSRGTVRRMDATEESEA